MSDNDIPVKEIGQLLDEVSLKVPKLIAGLMESVYSPENGTNMGRAVGNLYKELLDSGIPQEDALKIAEDYMLSMKDITKSMGDLTNNKR